MLDAFYKWHVFLSNGKFPYVDLGKFRSVDLAILDYYAYGACLLIFFVCSPSKIREYYSIERSWSHSTTTSPLRSHYPLCAAADSG